MYFDFQVHIISDGSSFVWSSINVIDLDWFFEGLHFDSFHSGIVLVDKLPTSTTVTIFLILFCLPMSFHYFSK